MFIHFSQEMLTGQKNNRIVDPGAYPKKFVSLLIPLIPLHPHSWFVSELSLGFLKLCMESSLSSKQNKTKTQSSLLQVLILPHYLCFSGTPIRHMLGFHACSPGVLTSLLHFQSLYLSLLHSEYFFLVNQLFFVSVLVEAAIKPIHSGLFYIFSFYFYLINVHKNIK